MNSKSLALLALSAALSTGSVMAESTEVDTSIQLPDMAASAASGTEAESSESLEDLAKKLNNPVSDLWMLFTQNDTYRYEDAAGEDYTINSFKFQPVMSFKATEDYNLIVRPVLQHLSMEAPGMDKESGMGDTALMAMIGPSDIVDNKIWGIGFTSLFPTASETSLTTQGKDQAAIGPALTYFHMGEQWLYGGVFQHWKGTGTPERNPNTMEREDINLTDLQYVVRYRLSPTTQIGFGPNVQVDWNEDGSDRFTVPVGFGGDTMIKIGKMPIRIGAELHYYVKQPDEFGPEWNLRLFAIPVMPNPTM